MPLSGDGKIKIDAHGTFNLMVDVLGYFAPNSAGGTTVAGGDQGAFTPAGETITSGVTVAGKGTTTVQIAGAHGVPVAGSGITAVAVNVQIHENGTTGGYAQFYPDDDAAWASNQLNYLHNLTVSSFATVKLGADGGIKITNASPDSITVGVALEGWYTNLTDSVIVGNKGAISPSQHSVALQAVPETGSSTASTPVTYLYRIGTTGAFTAMNPADLSAESDGSALSSWPLSPVNGAFPIYDWDARAALGNSNVATLLQVEACYGTSSADPNWLCTMPDNLEYQPGSFGETSATTAVGPGEVSLLTGDFALSAEDASISDSVGSESIGRTVTTLLPSQGTAEGGASAAQSVFGPGWNADLSGPSTGDGDLAAWDFRSLGYMEFTDPSGTAYFYDAVGSVNTYPITFAGVGEAGGDGTLVTLTDSTQTKVTMAEPDGTVTTWTWPNSTIPRWTVASVTEPGSNTTTSYTYDSNDLVTRILAPVPAGISCSTPDATTGCRSLKLGYTTMSVGGANVQRLTSVTASIPGATSPSVTMETYGYNSAGYLTSATDARTGLTTSYTYTTSGTGSAAATRLATITAPGINPWSLSYDGQGRISTVVQSVPVTDPSSGTVTSQNATTTVVYDLPRSGVAGLPSLSGTSTAAWAQTSDLPVRGTAVFPPDHQPNSTAVANMGTGDWAYATLHYLDVNGREVDTAAYSQTADPADGWLIDSTRYDSNGNVTWTLSSGNRAQALGHLPIEDSYAAAATADSLGLPAGTPDTAARAGLLASVVAYNPLDPTEVTDTYGPIHPVTLSTGAVVHARSHTRITYDEGAPNGGINPATNAAYRLPTTVTTAPLNYVSGYDATYPDASTTTSGYAAVGSMSSAGVTGWSLGQATTSTVQMGASASNADLTTTTVYDADGRTIATWLPGDSTGTTPRATKTTYYTATASGTCGSAANAGLVCQTSPGGQPSAGAPLPTSTIGYNQWAEPGLASGVYGNSTRIATATYDSAGRQLTAGSVMYSAPSDNTTLPSVTYGYDTATGLPASTTTGTGTGAQSLTTTYNSVGAVATYTDATGSKTTYGYDIDGRLIRQADGAGTTTWTYDSSVEHRGLPTAEDIGLTSTQVGGGQKNFTATYDADGNLAVQTYPGGITATHGYDNAGNQTSLTYKTAAGTTLMAFSQTIGTTGTGSDHIVSQISNVNGSPYSSQTFTDDPAGRLTTVQDALNGTGGASTCTTRKYGFDTHSNRTSLNTYPAGSAGACSTATSPATTSYSYDDADRLNTETYDALGRVSTLPAAEAAGIGSHAATNGGPSGDVALGYYSNDMVATQTQGTGSTATSIAFGLDPDQNRVLTEATTVAGGTKAGTTSLTNHYDDDTDAPAWTTTAKPDGTTTSSWLVEGLDGGLDATVTANGTGPLGNGAGVTLSLVNLHGDIVATCAPDATSITGYHETTEYGLPRDPAAAADDYGWVGAAKRSTDDLGGLTLMGARVYNPGTGRFLSGDPIPGGNPNTYTYPVDPVNGSDLSGQWPHVPDVLSAVGNTVWKHRNLIVAGGVAACVVVSTGTCAVATVIITGTIHTAGYATHHESGKSALTNAAVDSAFAGVGYGIGKAGDHYIESAVEKNTLSKGAGKAASYASNVHAGLPGATWTAGNYYQEKAEAMDRER